MTNNDKYKPLKRGLEVQVISDHSDHSVFTSITIRFVVPGEEEPIDKDMMSIIKGLFKKYIQIVGYDKSIFHFENLDSTGVNIKLWEYMDKETALRFVVEMCQYVCSITIPEEKKSNIREEAATCLESTQKYIGQYLFDITENGLYEYEER